MSSAWGQRRKFLYSSVALLIAAVLLAVLWEVFFSTPAMCFDNKQNGGESGIDCGGPCSRICAVDVHAPVVLWSRSFLTAPSTYTSAAYIQNNNQGDGARQVHYTFQLYDAQNELVTEKDGVADLPPVETIPIIETNINVGTRSVSRTLFTFSEVPVWNKVYANTVVPLTITNQNLAADGSRVSATLVNGTLKDAKNVTVTAVLFDSAGIARAASKSVVADVASKSSRDVVFTWPSGTPNIVQAEITILPSF